MDSETETIRRGNSKSGVLSSVKTSVKRDFKWRTGTTSKDVKVMESRFE